MIFQLSRVFSISSHDRHMSRNMAISKKGQ